MDYNDYEEKGRNKLKKDFEKSKYEIKYEFTEDKYNHIDCYATANTGVKYAIEIKDRDISINKYETIILEKIKYKALMEAYEKNGYKPIYRCYFKDGVLTWDLSLLNIENRIEKKMCAESTENYKHKIEKQIIMLNKDESIDKNRNNINNC